MKELVPPQAPLRAPHRPDTPLTGRIQGPGESSGEDGEGGENGENGGESHQAAFYRDVLDHLYDGVYFVDKHRRITYWNRGAERISGYAAEAVVGNRCADGLLQHVDEHGRPLCGRRCPLLRTMHDGTPREAHVFLHHADGHRIPVLVRAAPMCDVAGRIVGAVETFSDNSSLVNALKRIHELDDVAFRDPLTGVGNRRYADLKLDSSLTEFRGHGLHHGVFFVDIDRFKAVNDVYGHLAGDRVLAVVGRTMQASLRTTDLVARWGGEEFLAIVFNVDAERLAALAENIRVLVARSAVSVDNAELNVTISIGATLMRPNDDRDSLVARADALMYRSKQEGRDRVTTG
jgi:diguanylate cyclase (GGDEF)-like protein/PAS domain S-box-containing protein